MKNKDFYDIVNSVAPFDTAADFDNVGLIVGNMQQKVKKVLVCLDITFEVINEAISVGANLIVSHHPVIFDPLKRIDANSVLYSLIKNDISALCCHTNFDRCASIGVNRAFADKVGFKEIFVEDETDYFQANLEKEYTTEEFAQLLKEKFPNTVLSYSNLDKKFQKIAMCSGSGSGVFGTLKDNVSAYMTGELKHEQWLLAREKGIVVFALGHYETEKIYAEYMEKLLKDHSDNVEILLSKCEVNPIKRV